MEPRLIDVVKAFEQRGRDEEAEYYGTVIPLELGLIHQLSKNEVLMMTISEIEGWYQKPLKPLKYEGWSHWWGGAVNADRSERDT